MTSQICTCNVIHADVVERVQKEKAVADDYSNLANLYKCFADSTRVQILHALEISELCVCDIAAILEMTKSAISHQLKMLREANLVTTRRVGKIVFYSLADDHVKQILDMGFDHVNEKE